jgi:hypothetical protein
MLRTLPSNGRCLQSHRLATGLHATLSSLNNTKSLEWTDTFTSKYWTWKKNNAISGAAIYRHYGYCNTDPSIIVYCCHLLLLFVTTNIPNDTISSSSLSHTRMHANNSTNYVTWKLVINITSINKYNNCIKFIYLKIYLEYHHGMIVNNHEETTFWASKQRRNDCLRTELHPLTSYSRRNMRVAYKL